MIYRSYLVTGIWCAVLFSLAAVFFHFGKPFTFQNITCVKNLNNCPDFVSAELDTYRGRSFFFTDLKPLEEIIRQNTPSLESVVVAKALPNTLSVTIKTSGPRYVLVDSTNTPWVVDIQAFITEQASDELLPRVGIAAPYQFYVTAGDKLPEELHKQLLITFPELQREPLLGVRFFLLNEREAELRFPDGKKAMIRLREDLLDIKKLQYILEHQEENTFKAPVTEIDLRYGQVIVRTASASGETRSEN